MKRPILSIVGGEVQLDFDELAVFVVDVERDPKAGQLCRDNLDRPSVGLEVLLPSGLKGISLAAEKKCRQEDGVADKSMENPFVDWQHHAQFHRKKNRTPSVHRYRATPDPSQASISPDMSMLRWDGYGLIGPAN